MDRNAAWKPVGLDLTGSKTVTEALEKAELNFTVDKKPVYDEFGNAVPNWFRNVRSDTKNTLGIVTGKYNIVQNEDAFEFINNLIPNGLEFEKGGVWHNGSAVWVEAKLPESYKILGDDVDTHVCFINSHNGLGAVKVALLPFRLFCSNQLNFALHNAKRMWSIVHSSKVDERIAEARESLGLAETYMNELSKEAERLAMKKMDEHTFTEIINKIYPLEPDASNRKITNVNEIKAGLLECLKADDLSNFRGTAWEKLGAVTDFFDHRTPQRNTAGFEDARWEKITSGHPDVDKFYSAIIAA